MFVISPDIGGTTVIGTGGRVFEHYVRPDIVRPKVALWVKSDKVTSREIWQPNGPAREVIVDTGADYTCIHTQVLLGLGISESGSDVAVNVVSACGKKIKARRKFIAVKLSGFQEAFMIPINYSRDFKEGLFVLSLASLVQYYGMAMSHEKCVLFTN